MIDYARPLIVIEQQTKLISDLCLEKRYEEAIELCKQMNYELLTLVNNLAKMSNV